MKEWDIHLKKGVKKDFLGIVVAKSPEEAIKLFFEPEEIVSGYGKCPALVYTQTNYLLKKRSLWPNIYGKNMEKI